jgi:serine phosphatase RsbU (regulator of sigma subunit)
MAPQIFRFFHTLHEILTRDLTLDELNKSLGDDMQGIYEFYARSMKSVEWERNKVKRTIKVIWHLFVSFLLKLTPARRFIYAVAVFFMLIAFSQGTSIFAFSSFIIISILLAMELADKLITKDELSIARDIQLSLQPTSNVTLPGFELAAYSEVAKQVGGDYYDILTLLDGSKLVVIGDVSGKGISSALYVVKIQTALQLFATETSDPRELLIRLNSHIYGQFKRNYFLSLFLVKLQIDGNIELCRAGHPPALLYRSTKKVVSWLKPDGIALGIAPSSNGNEIREGKGKTGFQCSFETQSIYLERGDVLFLFTDGVSESVNANRKEFGQERIVELIKSFSGEPIDSLRNRIIDKLRQHRTGMDLRDDTTFVLLKRV